MIAELFLCAFVGQYELSDRVMGLAYPPDKLRRAELLKRLESRTADEDQAEEVMAWYEKGDRSTLKTLLLSAETADGALSELVGPWMARRLLLEPEFLLRAVSKRRVEAIRILGYQVAAADGGGHQAEIEKQLRQTLQRMARSKDRRVRSTAVIWLEEMEKFLRTLNEPGK